LVAGEEVAFKKNMVENSVLWAPTTPKKLDIYFYERLDFFCYICYKFL